MKLYEKWIKQAYDQKGQSLPRFWKEYIPKEQKIYEDILSNKITNICGSVKSLAEKYGVPETYICGFVDGIKEATDFSEEVAELDEETDINLNINFETLYGKMVEYKADHLYSLPQWEGVLSEEKREEITHEMTDGKTFVRENPKIGRNDPCPCGSGKKHKKCCGA